MEKLIEKLLGRPFMAAGENGGADGGNGAAAQDGAGGSNDTQGGASDNDGAGAGKSGPSAADIAARAGGAFASRSGAKGNGDGANGSADGKAVEKHANGGGDWPEGLPEKFRGKAKGEVNIPGIVKAYNDLETAHSQLKSQKGFGKAGEKPEDYLSDGLVIPKDHPLDRIREFDAKNDPAINAFRTVAHRHKLPPEVAAGIALDFLSELNPLMDVPRTEADIIKDLGDGGANLRDQLGVWLEGQFTSKNFSESELAWSFQHFGGSADGVRVLAKLREAMGEKPIPLNGGTVEGLPSQEEWYAMHRDPKMRDDPAFRAKVEAIGEQLFGNEPAGTSPAGVGLPPPREMVRRERPSTQR